MIKLSLPFILFSGSVLAQIVKPNYSVKEEELQNLVAELGLQSKYDSILAQKFEVNAYVSIDSLTFDRVRVNGITFMYGHPMEYQYKIIRIYFKDKKEIPFTRLDAYIPEGTVLRKGPEMNSKAVYSRYETDWHDELKVISETVNKKGELWLEVQFSNTTMDDYGAITIRPYKGWMLASELTVYAVSR
jgi:hypothetical protein